MNFKQFYIMESFLSSIINPEHIFDVIWKEKKVYGTHNNEYFLTEGFFEAICEVYAIEKNIYQDKVIEMFEEKDVDLEKWLVNKIKIRYNEIEKDLVKLIFNNYIKIYRKMQVDENWINNFKNGNVDNINLGFHWTTDIEKAQSYHSLESKKEVLLVSNINIDKINWPLTVMNRMHFTYGDNEKEITPIKGSKIKIKELYIDNEKNNIDNIKELQFKI